MMVEQGQERISSDRAFDCDGRVEQTMLQGLRHTRATPSTMLINSSWLVHFGEKQPRVPTYSFLSAVTWPQFQLKIFKAQCQVWMHPTARDIFLRFWSLGVADQHTPVCSYCSGCQMLCCPSWVLLKALQGKHHRSKQTSARPKLSKHRPKVSNSTKKQKDDPCKVDQTNNAQDLFESLWTTFPLGLLHGKVELWFRGFIDKALLKVIVVSNQASIIYPLSYL